MGDGKGSDAAKKLAILLPHLIRHNIEHAEDLDKWIAIAGEDGCGTAAKEMKKAQALMKKISDHLTLAAESIGADAPEGHVIHHDLHHDHHHHDHHHEKHHGKDHGNDHDHPHHHHH